MSDSSRSKRDSRVLLLRTAAKGVSFPVVSHAWPASEIGTTGTVGSD